MGIPHSKWLAYGLGQESHERCCGAERVRNVIDESCRTGFRLTEVFDRNEVFSFELLDQRVLGIEAAWWPLEAFADELVAL